MSQSVTIISARDASASENQCVDVGCQDPGFKNINLKKEKSERGDFQQLLSLKSNNS